MDRLERTKQVNNSASKTKSTLVERNPNLAKVTPEVLGIVLLDELTGRVAEFFDGMKGKAIDGPPYNVMEIPMDTAETDKELDIPGIGLVANTDGTLSGVSIKFDSVTYGAIPLIMFKNIQFHPFSKIYLTFTAQADKTLYLLVGREKMISEAT